MSVEHPTWSHSEIFEVFNDKNEKIGEEQRSIVHKKGLAHRSVNVLVFNSSKKLIIQQRMPNKDVAPSLWDLSVAEHLRVGEAYRDAAVRGLKKSSI